MTEPQVVDAVPGPGSYSYTLVAVGEDGQQSAESEAWIATVPAPPPAPLAWTSVPDGFQEPISNAGVAAHNGELWVVGGVSGSGSKRTSVRVFNPQTGWGNGPELPIGVSHAPLVSTGEKLYLLGGLITGTTSVNTVYSLDPADPNGTWVKDTPLPEPRFSGAAAWDGRRLVFAGGATYVTPARSRAPTSDILALRGETWERIAGLQEPREHLSAVTNADDTIWFLGGVDVGGSGDVVENNVDVLNSDNTVTDDTAITPVQGAAAIWTAETGVCIFGGSTTLPNDDDKSPVNLVDCLVGSEPDPEWPDLPQARSGAGAAVVGDTVYVVGGEGIDATETILALAGAVVPAE